MSSRREEERNEKIIRGLMKLPPNRKCINCNSVGPQYVCTNFWTFVCTTCSGIHREFTHRVKSVSMAKFTKEEVDAIQRGGNQHAREIFLKDWDMQHMRLPASSNVDRIREFIKNVYVSKKYAGRRTFDKPSSNAESLKNHEEDQRRASSYHSYSQSPPYENQYEDRRYGKQFGMLSRRPGSDRGHYEGKINSFVVYSPNHLDEQMYEDRFANEISGSRSSDFSVSSMGDTFRYDGRSPSSQDTEYCSPPLHRVREILVEDTQRRMLNRQSEANVRIHSDGIAHPQRTASAGSFGSFDGYSMSHRSVGSGGLSDDVVVPAHSTETHQSAASSFTFKQTSTSVHAKKQDPFDSSFVESSMASSTPSIDLFADFSNQPSSVTPIDQQSSAVPFSENEGWAKFDLPHHTGVASETKMGFPAFGFPGDGASKGTENASTSLQRFSVWSSVAPAPFTQTAGQWHADLRKDKSAEDQKSSQLWNAFDDSTGNMSHTLFESLPQDYNSQVIPSNSKSGYPQIGLKFPENSIKDGLQKPALDGAATYFNMPHVDGSSFIPLIRPLMEGATQAKNSINPFDLPYDSNLEANSSFLDMNSLKAAVPDPQLPTDYVGGLQQPWFPQNSAATYIHPLPEGKCPVLLFNHGLSSLQHHLIFHHVQEGWHAWQGRHQILSCRSCLPKALFHLLVVIHLHEEVIGKTLSRCICEVANDFVSLSSSLH